MSPKDSKLDKTARRSLSSQLAPTKPCWACRQLQQILVARIREVTPPKSRSTVFLLTNPGSLCFHQSRLTAHEQLRQISGLAGGTLMAQTTGGCVQLRQKAKKLQRRAKQTLNQKMKVVFGADALAKVRKTALTFSHAGEFHQNYWDPPSLRPSKKSAQKQKREKQKHPRLTRNQILQISRNPQRIDKRSGDMLYRFVFDKWLPVEHSILLAVVRGGGPRRWSVAAVRGGGLRRWSVVALHGGGPGTFLCPEPAPTSMSGIAHHRF